MNFSNLINLGYTAADILDVVSKKNTGAGRKIRKVLSLGYPAVSVLKHLIGDSDSSDESYLTREESTKNAIENQKSSAKKNLGLGALALAGGVGLLARGAGVAGTLAQGANAASQAGAIANNAQLPQASPQGPGPLSVQGIQQQAQQLGSPSSVPNQPNTPMGPPQPEVDYYQTHFHKNYPQLETFVKKHQEAGKSPEETYQQTQIAKAYSPIVKKYEEESGRPFSEAIEQIYNTGSNKTELDTPISKPRESELVMTPEGSGNIHKLHGDNAYVKMDGKLKKVPVSELEKPPQDVVEAVSNILKIPEIDRSSNVALYLYDPSESKMIIQFHDGSAYKYLDMDPEVIRKLAEKEATPITEGKNMYGAWSPDDPHGSLGAALWAYVLKDPKYKKAIKGQPANPNYMKLETLYDYWKDLRKKRK